MRPSHQPRDRTRAYGPLPPLAGPNLGRAERLGATRLEAFLVLVTIVATFLLWTWWAGENGAYYDGTSFYPGAILLCGLLGLIAWGAPLRMRLGLPVRLGILALAGLGAWTLASIAWTPSPDEAVIDGTVVLSYAVALALGLVLGHLLGREMTLSLTPIVWAGLAIALITVISAWIGGEVGDFFDSRGRGRLATPLGYYNANAAFLSIAAWAALALAGARDRDWRLRGLAFATATLCSSLAVLSQSRGWLVATVFAALVWVLVSRERARAVLHLAIAAVPVAAIVPVLNDVFSTAIDGGNVVYELGRACTFATAAALVAGAAGATVARAESRIRLPQPGSAATTALRALAAAVAVVGVLALIESDPVDFLNERVSEVTEGGIASGDELGDSRLDFNARSNRGDFWRVSLENFREDPLLGTGAGGFKSTYLLERDSRETAFDAHSMFFETLGELGLPGILLLLATLIATTIAMIQARKLGPAAGTLSAGALTVGAYWVVHAGVDWFWTYPAVTAPVFMTAGAAAAPAVLGLRPGPGANTRAAIAGVCVAVGLACVPLYLSARLASDARSEWARDPRSAYDKLDLAADLNPFSDAPLQFTAGLAIEGGETERALEALAEAQSREPTEWRNYALEACALRERDPAAALAALKEARELFPGGEDLVNLERRLDGRGRAGIDPCPKPPRGG